MDKFTRAMNNIHRESIDWQFVATFVISIVVFTTLAAF